MSLGGEEGDTEGERDPPRELRPLSKILYQQSNLCFQYIHFGVVFYCDFIIIIIVNIAMIFDFQQKCDRRTGDPPFQMF